MRLGIEQERHRKAERDAINLPLFQLTEERTHLSPRRLRTLVYRRHDVEPVVARRAVRRREVRIRLIATCETL